MSTIVLATDNQGKIKEISELLACNEIRIIPQAEKGVRAVKETGLTFIENAIIKARHAAAMTNLPALADDSGLVVPILKGEPGIFSSRYAGPKADSAQNINKLLKNLKGIRDSDRKAYFYCVIVLLQHAADPCPLVCEGMWQGRILHAPQGNQGFGYDPVFFAADDGCAAAELSLTAKNDKSHRGQAIKKLLERLPSLCAETT
jgi:XTP/dITP diphosphohydrolase